MSQIQEGGGGGGGERGIYPLSLPKLRAGGGGGGGGIPAFVAQITSRGGGGGGGRGVSPLSLPKLRAVGGGGGGGVTLALGQIRLMMHTWGLSGSINFNLAVNLLCVSLNTFRREIYNLQA